MHSRRKIALASTGTAVVARCLRVYVYRLPIDANLQFCAALDRNIQSNGVALQRDENGLFHGVGVVSGAGPTRPGHRDRLGVGDGDGGGRIAPRTVPERAPPNPSGDPAQAASDQAATEAPVPRWYALTMVASKAGGRSGALR